MLCHLIIYHIGNVNDVHWHFNRKMTIILMFDSCLFPFFRYVLSGFRCFLDVYRWARSREYDNRRSRQTSSDMQFEISRGDATHERPTFSSFVTVCNLTLWCGRGSVYSTGGRASNDITRKSFVSPRLSLFAFTKRIIVKG